MEKLTIIEKGVLDLIPRGSEIKVSINYISRMTSLDERSIYEVVNRLRSKGVPVCAKRNGPEKDRGYYIAKTIEERDEGLAAYKSQIVDMQKMVYEVENVDLDTWEKELNEGNQKNIS
ncbi:hypothetical protein [Enterococcus gilvus]|uniref:hypothetical protein n=1 Tax=Enterococcus gilvus TaxID=160453 RepID=UPI0029134D18|nr:hypothetical protein [Enterococcus gilvus]MDU5511620.1 hypothetical protein [Enterococcus gilvus]